MTQNAQHARRDTPHITPPYILAIDIGTSSARALLFDSTGISVPNVSSQHTYALNTSRDGEVSTDPDALVDLVAKIIDEVLQQAGPLASQIVAVATDTYWHNLLAVDAASKPLIPLITWEDTRPRQAAMELRSQLDETAIHKRTGARFHASYWPAKIRWLASTQPDIFTKTARWLSFGEYFQQRLLGRSVCSLSMASGTGLLNTRSRAWDSELTGFLQIHPEQLSPLGDLHDGLQGLVPEFASRWPVLHKVPWFPAIGDGAAANIGSGCADEGNWAITMGTSSAIRVVVPPDLVEPSAGLWLYLVDAKRGLIGGALSEGGNVLAWLDATLHAPPLAELEPQVAAILPDGHGLSILPFISGERSPGWHAEARMTISGINTHTSPADLVRASMESLAYQLGIVYDQLSAVLDREELAPTLIASGGALLSSPTLQSILSDTLNTPLYPSLEREASARGAALLALEALGIVPDVARVPVELGEPILPDTAHHGLYQAARERQERLYRVLLE